MPSIDYLPRADRLPTVRELLDLCGWQESVRLPAHRSSSSRTCVPYDRR